MAELTSLSPSRANDFLQCPLKFRFRSIDRLPEPPSLAAFKGTVVHSVLERLFTLPAEERTQAAAEELLMPAWSELVEKDPEVLGLFAGEAEKVTFFTSARALLRSYFTLEFPEHLEPAQTEKYVTTTLDNGLELRGFIDRVDIAPGGEKRLVDYKTGRQPKPQYGREAKFQMGFYALVEYRLSGDLVHTLQLMYLGSGTVVKMHPTPADLERTEFEIAAIWADIVAAAESDRWRPRKSPLCGWCTFKPLCPAWGGTPPATPEITRIVGA
ncbi:putative RecB family exonuclease [Brevibacterium sanguinis]|uniref:RecB family exonuclease n=2 Tax=Brevibacterium TaxID=1696 RepID=A0ABX9GP55_9MICO|nr:MULTISPECIES: PD-(D/E)XK nuclease family protein [Brevibacterium]RBP64690.1 putative RecB family exonuclease [Brevibacterium sanguinis]RBP71667.1 putative RecB family exonuclease [Brevibacterium celere]